MASGTFVRFFPFVASLISMTSKVRGKMSCHKSNTLPGPFPTKENLVDEEETAKEEDDPADHSILSAKECLIALSTVHMYGTLRAADCTALSFSL